MTCAKLVAFALAVVGLGATLVGAWIAAKAVILKEGQAVKIGVPRYGSTRYEENVKLPGVQNLLAQSRAARTGLGYIALGSFLQLIAAISAFFQ